MSGHDGASPQSISRGVVLGSRSGGIEARLHPAWCAACGSLADRICWRGPIVARIVVCYDDEVASHQVWQPLGGHDPVEACLDELVEAVAYGRPDSKESGARPVTCRCVCGWEWRSHVTGWRVAADDEA